MELWISTVRRIIKIRLFSDIDVGFRSIIFYTFQNKRYFTLFRNFETGKSAIVWNHSYSPIHFHSQFIVPPTPLYNRWYSFAHFHDALKVILSVIDYLKLHFRRWRFEIYLVFLLPIAYKHAHAVLAKTGNKFCVSMRFKHLQKEFILILATSATCKGNILVKLLREKEKLVITFGILFLVQTGSTFSLRYICTRRCCKKF